MDRRFPRQRIKLARFENAVNDGREGKQYRLVASGLAGALGALLLASLAPWGAFGNAGGAPGTVLGVVLGLALGLIVAPWVLGLIDLVLLVLYLLVAFTPVSGSLAARWVRADTIPAGPLDAIVVLSAGLESDSTISSDGADRLISGLELLKRSNTPRLITTRARESIAGQLITTDDDQRRLIALADEPAKWTVIDTISTTHDEAVRSAALLLPAHQRRIAVVTSPMHTRRACALFETAGFIVTCVPARERDFVTWHPVRAKDRLEAMQRYGYEVAGMVKYRIKGWIR
jgi:uncharacterized SAM-binding protein YcdF (DUF218 family)